MNDITEYNNYIIVICYHVVSLFTVHTELQDNYDLRYTDFFIYIVVYYTRRVVDV